jgi:hypothetical protein
MKDGALNVLKAVPAILLSVPMIARSSTTWFNLPWFNPSPLWFETSAFRPVAATPRPEGRGIKPDPDGDSNPVQTPVRIALKGYADLLCIVMILTKTKGTDRECYAARAVAEVWSRLTLEQNIKKRCGHGSAKNARKMVSV